MGIVATNDSGLLLDAIRELARYRNEDPTATAFNVGNSFYCTSEEWRRAVDKGVDHEGRHYYREPQSSAEIMEHYRRSVAGVSQQVFATYGIPGEVALRKRIQRIVALGSTVLDLGAGIGSQLLPFVDTCTCTHVDVGGVQSDYAAWRYKNAGATVEMVSLADDYMEAGIPQLKGRTFDVVICTEVIEHVPDPEALVALLATLVRAGGFCIATTSFDDGDGMVPMHLNINKY